MPYHYTTAAAADLEFGDGDCLSRTQTIEHLRRHITTYEKSATGIYELTEPHLEIAVQRAQRLRSRFHAVTGTDPFTNIDEVVEFLRSIRRA